MELFNQLDAQLTSLLKQGGQLLSIMPGLKEGSSEPVHDIAQKMLDGEMAFVHAVEAVRERLEQLLEWRSVQFTQLSLILTAIMLLLLVSTGLFLFRPAGQRIREIGDRLVAANEANAAAGRHLRSLAMELGQRNKELQASLGEVHRLHYAFLAQTGPAAFGTVARGIAGQMESPLRDLRNNTQQCLGLMGELDRELRQGSGRIPLRILDRLQEISSNLAMSLSGQVERMEVLEHLVTMVRRFVPERTEQDNPAQHSNQAEGVPTLRLTDVLLEAVQVFRAAGPELDPPGDPGITLAPAALDDLEIQVDGDESIQAPIPRQKFIAALLELLSNAARATRLRQQYGPAPTDYRRIIGLSVQLNPEEPGGFIIRVMDNGVGMTAEVRARSIEPFFTTKPGGLGMGLTSVMDLVTHELRGRLILTDTPGGGTTVKILLNPQYGPPESIVANP
jgi:signal transduction histidine kinase